MKQVLLLILITFGIQAIGFSQIDSTYQEFEEVLISSEREKKIAFEDPKYYIVDFTITETGALLLMKNFSDYYIYELDEEMNFRHKLNLKINANSLFDDCFGNTHVVTKDSVYFIFNDSLGLFLTEKHPRLEFMNAMRRCKGATSEKIIFENKSNFNQDQTFYTVDLESGDRNVIYKIKDSLFSRSMYEALSELFLVKHTMTQRKMSEGSLGGNVKDESDSQRIKNAEEDRSSFVASHLLRPKYNPIFALDDTLYIFNHLEGKAEVMSHNGKMLNSVDISYHLKKDWHKEVYMDKVDKKFYAVRVQKGVQHLIRLSFEEDGQNSSSKITKHAYPKKVFVRDGYAYYTYKPNFDANLNKLYRQQL